MGLQHYIKIHSLSFPIASRYTRISLVNIGNLATKNGQCQHINILFYNTNH